MVDPDVFWSNVQCVLATRCWEWRGATRAGYGRGWDVGLRKSVGAHRVSWELAHGPIPDGLWVLHRCDNPPCINPNHLFLGTNADNMADMLAKGRLGKRGENTRSRDQCPQGHVYDAENTYLYEGRRHCRACHKVYSRNYARRRYGYQTERVA